MCLIAFAIGASTRWPLVVASNRDEFFNRPTLALSQWRSTGQHAIVSGRDLQQGGTWLGATPTGRAAWLTNVREANPLPAPASRGELVLRWLEGCMSAADFMRQLDPAIYGGFNLVLGDLQSSSWTWLSNRRFSANPSASHTPVAGWVSKTLLPGIYGLSNAALDSPWPKTLLLKHALGLALRTATDQADLERPLWQALANREPAPDALLPATGLPMELEQALSSAFVELPQRGTAGYGTRCSTLLIAEVEPDARGVLPVPSAQRLPWTIRLEERTWPTPADEASAMAGAGRTIKTAFTWRHAAE